MNYIKKGWENKKNQNEDIPQDNLHLEEVDHYQVALHLHNPTDTDQRNININKIKGVSMNLKKIESKINKKNVKIENKQKDKDKIRDRGRDYQKYNNQ